ncbi:hypothetical protein QRO11_15090 [Paracidovorax citrulli]|uniref:hypothetical protein n=1 Tax=Paracidovorax citrulli TaxID=80869 RepID=UPI00031F24D9|nr:hypothetical protein [Paracidovorax citrulli]QCX12224.1 hypothetical protein APS58_3470 [Paracidovorax citrulli]UEG44809.1 hypothetical protein LKW27_14240 [Paracidovorax citrulli]UMT87845.1 hypothetical protein FRC90_06995 [Paracidovorax citrulli]UMT97455.1 hypothetical protein FRC97_22140 [Paracidovorax citrulli]WIY33274.1 hypothetical protein QRO11_15090 [Paracidovorax citrulli]
MHILIAGALLAALSLPSGADGGWFTVYGDPAQSERDLIQIRPASIAHLEGDLISVEVRVTRESPREAYGGGQYRGHQSVVAVDCPRREAWYTRMRFYTQPGWAGPVEMERSFRQGEAPVKFNAIPDQADRLVRAACRLRR